MNKGNNKDQRVAEKRRRKLNIILVQTGKEVKRAIIIILVRIKLTNRHLQLVEIMPKKRIIITIIVSLRIKEIIKEYQMVKLLVKVILIRIMLKKA